MLKLYGFPVSNYFNMVKIALLEKQIEFEEVLVYPNQEHDYLSKSPMGKVPCIETAGHAGSRHRLYHSGARCHRPRLGTGIS